MAEADQPPCVVTYLYVHPAGEQVEYPTARAGSDNQKLAQRYLECVLVQAVSLHDSGCDIVFVTNAADGPALGSRGNRLLESIRQLGVDVRFAEYRHRPPPLTTTFQASRYVFDAIEAVVDAERTYLFTDVDCLWVDSARVFTAAMSCDGIGCVQLRYPDDWDLNGHSPADLALVAERLGGASTSAPLWIGGELLAGSGPRLRRLVESITGLEGEARDAGVSLHTEEQALTLAHALNRVAFQGLNDVAGRIWTGPRHGAANPPHPLELGLWHLPGEKGLGFRRAANDILAGREWKSGAQTTDAAFAARRFSVGEVGPARRLSDLAWLTSQRCRAAISARVGS